MIATEYDECFSLCRWFNSHRIVHVHIPNEGKRSKVAAARLKAIGMQPAFPDYLVLTRPPLAPEVPGVALEMKRRDGKKPTKDQRQWLELLKGLGWLSIACNGWVHAVEELQTVGYGCTSA